MRSVWGQIHIKEFHVLIVGREPAIFVFVPLSKSFYFHEFSQHACKGMFQICLRESLWGQEAWARNTSHTVGAQQTEGMEIDGHLFWYLRGKFIDHL